MKDVILDGDLILDVLVRLASVEYIFYVSLQSFMPCGRIVNVFSFNYYLLFIINFQRSISAALFHIYEILGDPYRRQVPLPRIPNNQAQDSTRDSAQPYVQTFGPYVQMNIGQQKPE